jgi:hypothetical protein
MQTHGSILTLYVIQTKRQLQSGMRPYGVLVTLTAKKGTAGFWVDDDVWWFTHLEPYMLLLC